MKFAIVVFPGTSCEQEMYHAVKDVLGEEAELVWYKEANLENYDAVILPGGASFGNYLRGGALASQTEVVQQLKELADKGTPILGVGNGFQVLLESGILPGAMLRNENLQFICQFESLVIENNQTMFTSEYEKGEIVSIPIANAESNYYCDADTLALLQANNQIVLTYQNNPNGSLSDIAGIVNEQGNVLGMMPQPERATEAILGSSDGLKLFQSIVKNWRESYVTGA